MSEKEIWEKVLDLAKERISKISFDTFVKDTQLYSLQNDKAIVLVSESFNANWLNQKYSEIMQNIIYEVIGYEVKPRFITEEELSKYMKTDQNNLKNLQLQKRINIRMSIIQVVLNNLIHTIHLTHL